MASDGRLSFPTEYGMDWFGLRSVKEYLKFMSGGENILDAKFGSGKYCSGRLCFALAHALPGASVTGADANPELVAAAKKKAADLKLTNVSFTEGDHMMLPFPDASFDAAYDQCLENFPDYEKGFAELVRVVRPGGKVLMGVPNWYCLPHTLRKFLIRMTGGEYEYGFEKSFKHSEVRDLFVRHGLTDIEFTGFYPMQSIIRLEGFSRIGGLLRICQVGRISRFLERTVISMIDSLTGNWFSRQFGYEIIVKGVKR
ncbi:class I SAM-dependent methyltransferase [Candidatus Altiarchaeota archaeon]